MQSYRLPDQTYTYDKEAYAKAWTELSDDLTKIFNEQGLDVECIGLDPNLSFAQVKLDSSGKRVFDHYGPVSQISPNLAIAIQNLYKQTLVNKNA